MLDSNSDMSKLFQTFQRIQRNRHCRIRVKLSRRAGKRPDEILEEETNDDKHKLQQQQQLLLQQQQHLQRMKPKPINGKRGASLRLFFNPILHKGTSDHPLRNCGRLITHLLIMPGSEQTIFI